MSGSPGAPGSPPAATPPTTPKPAAAAGDPGPPSMVINRTTITGNLDIWTQREDAKEVAYYAGSDIDLATLHSELMAAKQDYLNRIAVIDKVLAASDVRRGGPRKGRGPA